MTNLSTPTMPISSSNQSMDTLRLLRILQLASSNLPVGGYTFSQGLEYAIEEGWLNDATSVKHWVEQVSTMTLVHADLPLIYRQYLSAESTKSIESVKSIASGGNGHNEGSEKWNRYALAIRETRELLLADTAMGEALLRLAKSLNVALPEYCLKPRAKISFTTMFSLVALHMKLSVQEACSAYAWTVIESQVLAATKLLPMGQTVAQTMLYELTEQVAECVNQAASIDDEYIGISLPGLAMASAKHETQYSRLYRS